MARFGAMSPISSTTSKESAPLMYPRFRKSNVDAPTHAEQSGLIDRIIEAFRRGAEGFHRAMTDFGESPWSENGWTGRQSRIMEALRSGDCGNLHGLLSKFFESRDAYGLALGCDELEQVTASEDRTNHYLTHWRESLEHLALNLGVVRATNPEIEDAAVRSLKVFSDEALVLAIEKHTGSTLEFPPAMAPFGVTVCDLRLPVPTLALNHYMVAIWCRWLCKNNDDPIVELGPGYGGVGYFLAKQGHRRYTGFDLPFASAVQAYFLGTALGADAIRLFGENPTNEARVHLLPSWTLLDRSLGNTELPSCNLFLSQDCLVEITPHLAGRYLNSILAATRAWVLLIAPDRSGSSADWIGTRSTELLSAHPQFRRIERSLYSMRPGYFRELYLREPPDNCHVPA